MFKIKALEEEQSNKLELKEASDGGINLICKTTEGKTHYILRVKQDGTIKVFSRNPSNIGFKVDSAGRVVVEFQNAEGDAPEVEEE